MPKQKAWGGIDPGLSGCACLLTPDRIWFHDFESEKMAVAKIEQWTEAFNVKFLLEKQVDVRTKKAFNKLRFLARTVNRIELQFYGADAADLAKDNTSR
jgi:hypothetical protein